MECVAFFLFMLMVLGVTMSIASQGRPGANRWRRAFSILARRFNGHYQSGGWFGRPNVRFYYGGAIVLVDAINSGRPRRTYLRVQISYPDRELKCEALPRRTQVNDYYRNTRSSSVGQTGAMESEYVLRGEPDYETRRFFSDGVHLQMSRIRFLLGNDDVGVSVSQGQMLVRKEFPKHGVVEHVGELVKLSLELYDQALLSRSQSIEFLQHQTVESIEDCICKVCGEGLTEDVVLCRRCKTPHHRDCWMYYGACSTYGCREPEFVIPRVAMPLVSPPSSETSTTLD